MCVLDSEDRENEGDLIISSEKVTDQKMAWMIKQTSGVICVSMPKERLDYLELPLMVERNTECKKKKNIPQISKNIGD